MIKISWYKYAIISMIIAADNLLTAINRSKEKISEELKAKQEKIDTMLNLLENDPEIKKRYNELMTGKEIQ